MHRLQIGGIDRRQSPGQRRADFAVVNQRLPSHPNLALLIHVGRAVDRPREHQLVVDRHRLALENHDIECLGIRSISPNRPCGAISSAMSATCCSVCVVEKTKAGGTDAEFGDLWRERTRMVDDVGQLQALLPTLRFPVERLSAMTVRSVRCRAIWTAIDPTPPRATDDEDRLRRTGYGLRHVQAVEHRLPGRQRRQRQRRRFRPEERRRFVTDRSGRRRDGAPHWYRAV